MAMKDLIRLIYVSRAQNTLMHAKEIIRVAQNFNSQNDLTGVLIATPFLYIQAIEGDSTVIDSLYARIVRDTRHRDPFVLFRAATELRFWPEWSMHLMSMSHWKAHAGALAMADYADLVATGADVCERIHALKH
jgi:Sensors of blue-light using FAD